MHSSLAVLMPMSASILVVERVEQRGEPRVASRGRPPVELNDGHAVRAQVVCEAFEPDVDHAERIRKQGFVHYATFLDASSTPAPTSIAAQRAASALVENVTISA